MKRKITAYLLVFFSISLLFSVSAADLYNAAGEKLPTSVPKTPETSVESAEPELYEEESVEEESAAPTSCKDIQDAIDNKITMYATLKPDVLSNLESMEVKINAYIEKAEVLGYDTTDLENSMTELNSLVVALNSGLTRFQNLLKTTSAYACRTTEEAYVNSLVQAKSGLADVRESIEAIQDFYQQDIRNSILVLSQGDTQNE